MHLPPSSYAIAMGSDPVSDSIRCYGPQGRMLLAWGGVSSRYE